MQPKVAVQYLLNRFKGFSFSVLGSDGLCVSSENTVFLALMKWAEVNEVFDEALEPLLELVRFKAITINYLRDVVTSDHPIAATVPKFPLMFEEAVFYHAFSKVTEAVTSKRLRLYTNNAGQVPDCPPGPTPSFKEENFLPLLWNLQMVRIFSLLRWGQ